jgi:uncharacterized membrane protein
LRLRAQPHRIPARKIYYRGYQQIFHKTERLSRVEKSGIVPMKSSLQEVKMLGRIVTLAAVAAGGVMLSKTFRKSRNSGYTSTVENSIEVNVPVSTAYNQWTQFEEFPRFMKGVREVRQIDDIHWHWRAEIAGKEEEWDAEITEQVPDQRIAWRSTSGAKNSGVVSFYGISDSKTRVVLKMDYGPQGFLEGLGDALGAVKARTSENLQCFKEFLESHGKETGAWRGSVGSIGQH